VIDRILIALFILALSSFALGHLLGLTQILLNQNDLLFGTILLISMGMGVNSVIVAFTALHYLQERNFRDLALFLIALDGILMMVFYLITCPASEPWSYFADRDRNRTIITAFTFILIPFLLLGSPDQEATTSKKQEIISGIWGLGIMPSILLIFLLSPEPLFVTTQIGQGLSGISPFAWVILSGALAALVGTFVKSLIVWRREQSRIAMAHFMMLTLWTCSVVTFSVQSNPFQLSEILWFWGFISGFAIIAVAIIITNVIEPQKELAALVKLRTEELESTEKETEFYLNIWAHKVGNILQGMTTYLDLFSEAPNQENLTRPQEVAKELGGEATIINRQVAALLRVKENKEPKTWPVHLQNKIRQAHETSREILGQDSHALLLEYDEDVHVIADDLLDLVFISIFKFVMNNCTWKEPVTKLEIGVVKGRVLATIGCEEITLSMDAELALSDGIIPEGKHLGLEIFTAKILMTYYGGSIGFRKEPLTNQSLFVLDFKQYHR
jgi:hypothetical protein